MNPKKTPAAAPMRLKLLIDTRGKRVVFAEVGKDFVDFLLRILSLPVANAVGLLDKDAASALLGSVANLHGSIDSLKTYFTTDVALLKAAANLSSLSSPPPPANPSANRCYACRAALPFTGQTMSALYQSILRGDVGKWRLDAGGDVGVGVGVGVVKGFVSYMVTDELRVMPLSTASTINEMNKLNIERMADLQETVVQFTMDEADKFWKTALQSKSVLTDFFLKNTLCKDTCQDKCPPRTTVKREVPIWVDDDDSTGNPGPSRTTRMKKKLSD